jgi:hypothetical protein
MLLSMADPLDLILRFADNKSLLRLSMTCRAMRARVDRADDRLARALWIPADAHLRGEEHRGEVIVRVDCDAVNMMQYRLRTATTGRLGELVQWHVVVRGLHTDATFTVPAAPLRASMWRVVCVASEDRTTGKYGRFKLTLEAMLTGTAKRVFAVFLNAELPLAPVARRTLLALRQTPMCMTCGTRFATYCAVDSPAPSMIKLCKRCANEQLVTERVLMRTWAVGYQDIAVLRRAAVRYYATSSDYYHTWIPKYIVCEHFQARSWGRFIRNTFRRQRRQQAAGVVYA